MGDSLTVNNIGGDRHHELNDGFIWENKIGIFQHLFFLFTGTGGCRTDRACHLSLAVPSDVYSITGQGTNQLILEGAEIYLNPRQLLVDECDSLGKYKEKIKSNIKLKEQNTRNLNEIENKILSVLKTTLKL